ncbi:hypothetical protein H0A36_23480 [Endozoicomonas sp. SM1973]|uniref:Uncharacterized protein n=1 Tax=Spartinivicinus marinus TaxID=2994442 RepID=A0A853IMH1_9GAMM|nr:hypothetical protein [Spartinivicinus marinus]MCX4025060.1 hypothetical protein [Spartinivicinus marinus]NYZ68986.1 hypothetical protein [Spartinivicinus marinus]
MGLWIAFLYPNALQRLVDPEKIENVDFSEASRDATRLEGLVGSVLRSAFVVMMIMFIFILKLLFTKTTIYNSNANIIDSAALSFSIVLGILQFESIWKVIISNIMFVNDFHKKKEDRQADADI